MAACSQRFLCVCAGAFKTLDTDNSGSIELDIKEVKQAVKWRTGRQLLQVCVSRCANLLSVFVSQWLQLTMYS